jgi:hypothetical protein
LLYQEDKEEKMKPQTKSQKYFNYEPIGKALRRLSQIVTSCNDVYIWEPVEGLNINIPVRRLSPEEGKNLLERYLRVRCDSNTNLAKEKRLWMVHVISETLPHAETLVEGLLQGGYLNIYTESILYKQIYEAILRVNPALEYEKIVWPEEPQKLSNYAKSILQKTIPAAELLKMRWSEDVNSADDVSDLFTKLIKALRTLQKLQ